MLIENILLNYNSLTITQDKAKWHGGVVFFFGGGEEGGGVGLGGYIGTYVVILNILLGKKKS